MEFYLKDFFVGWLVDGISFGGGSVWISKCFVLISSTNCLYPSAHHFQVH